MKNHVNLPPADFIVSAIFSSCQTKTHMDIKAVLKKAPSSDEMVQYLESIDLDITEFEKMYGNDKIKDAVLYAKDLKDRYTVLWLYRNCCV